MFDPMNGAKITLSSKELDLVCNIDWILTKQAIMEKVCILFGAAIPNMQEQVLSGLPAIAATINTRDPKIAKGEQYKQLPYVILDYPRCFEKEHTLAIRTMFWWGNYFSIHLQLAGIYKDAAAAILYERYELLKEQGYSICIANDPWQHHFEADNYLSLKECTREKFSAIIVENGFVKIGKSLPLRQWDDTTVFIEEAFEELLQLLSSIT